MKVIVELDKKLEQRIKEVADEFHKKVKEVKKFCKRPSFRKVKKVCSYCQIEYYNKKDDEFSLSTSYELCAHQSNVKEFYSLCPVIKVKCSERNCPLFK